MTRVAVLVPAPGYPLEWDWAYRVEAQALERAGMKVEPIAWTEAANFASFDAVLPLVAWGYQSDPSRWNGCLDLLEEQARSVLNPVTVLRWNSDKSYLDDLAVARVATIPTLRFAAFDETGRAAAHDRFGEEIVIKPPVSASAYGTYRLASSDPLPEPARGRPMLAQPFCPAVMDEGEYSLLFFGHVYSHCLVKRPRNGDYRVQQHLGGSEVPCDPPEGAVEIAQAALDVAPGRCTYARVDLLRGPDNALRVIELELIEPALWLECCDEAPRAFASAVLGAIQQ